MSQTENAQHQYFTKSQLFQEGEIIVSMIFGVGLIDKIKVVDHNYHYYSVKDLHNEFKIMIPFHLANFRRISQKDDFLKSFECLEPKSNMQLARRYNPIKWYSSMHKRDLAEIVSLASSLYQDDRLSQDEERMLVRIKMILADEYAYLDQIDNEKAQKKIEQWLYKGIK